MDRLRLKGLTLFPRLGVTEWEKEGVNKVLVDVDLYLDLSVAAREDRVSATVDYSEAYAVLTAVSKSRKFHLIESMAQDLADALLAKYPKVARVRIRLRKRSLPFDAHLDHVEVSLDRGR
ncbi:MAG: dihydroneopterin aldolase [Candidatus Eisenbacteria bacterium]|uniref:7,8-dihydroneopterin aldolase n=1 Tax=Eiseniibacteriota bacterium TaxID=2212470 RepID=A0A956LZX0_UNCEI|nr:dihydroneopterin aldolase [Candidatus Eisenbacteria bacterium]